MSLLDTASLVITPNGTKAGKLYSVVPSSGAGDMTVTRATTATRVNSAGLIESVASNVPRLDYSNGTCPSILVEPQRTNLLTYSEEFNNGAWTLENTTITANATVSPDGTTTADKIIASAVGGDKSMYQIANVNNGVVYTTTVYYKASEYTLAWMRLGGVSNNPYLIYNLTTQTLVSSANLVSSSITSMGNGWYKITASVTTTSTVLAPNIMMLPATGYTLGADNIPEFTGNGLDGGFIWGAQLEAGSYATSYIPTTSASVTRNADVISKTGISSLIGQTEGTVFVDFNRTSTNEGGLQLGNSDGPNDYLNSIILQWNVNGVYTNIFVGGATQFSNTSSSVTGRHKLAVVYKANDFALYIDGIQIATDTSGSIPSLAAIFLNHQNFALTGTNINTSALWKTRLTNTQLAQLTTI